MAYSILSVDDNSCIADSMPCSHCEDELQGTPIYGYCPSCQTPVNLSVAGRAVCKIDENRALAEFTKCHTCHYELHGLDPGSNCPECGSPIGFSLENRLLRYTGTDWLAKVSSGFLFYAVMIFVSILLGIGAGVAGVFIGDAATKMTVVMSVGAITSLLSMIAIWFMTSPLPAESRNAPTQLTRLAARIFAVLVVPSVLMASVAQLRPELTFMAQIPQTILGTLLAISLWLYCRTIAGLIPDESLQRQSTTVAILFAVGGIVGLVGLILFIAIGFVPAQPGASQAHAPQVSAGLIGGGIVSCLGGIASIIALVWGIILLFKFRNRFVACKKEAVALYSNDDGADSQGMRIENG